LLEGYRAMGTTGKNPNVGCVLVKNNSIIARARTSPGGRPHAEENLISQLSKTELNGSSLFVTLEPCTMCASAISEVHIKDLYFGAYDEKNGGIEKLRVAFQRENIFMPTIYGGIMEKECSNLLKKFFKNKSDR